MEVITEEAAESSRHDIFLCSLHDFSQNVKAKTNRTFLREKTRIFRSRKENTLGWRGVRGLLRDPCAAMLNY